MDVLVVTDHFTTLVCGNPCPNKTAKTIAHMLWNNFFCGMGFRRACTPIRGQILKVYLGPEHRRCKDPIVIQGIIRARAPNGARTYCNSRNY